MMSIALCASATNTSATAEYSDSTLHLSEISITAVKTVAHEGETPGSATSLPRYEVERRNIVNTKDVSITVPNFYIPDYGSRVTSSIYVRGIGARIDQPVIGFNIDNIPVLNKDNYDFDLLDIESIEVLRGPQSTLHGRNTMGGLVSIRTLSPLTYQGTRLIAEYGNKNSIKAGASHYSAFAENFGIGAGIYYTHTDGFFTNRYNREKCDKENAVLAALKLEWIPKEGLTVMNSASMSVVRQGGYAYEFVNTGEINYNDTCFYRRNTFLDGLTVKWQHEKFLLTGVASYQYIDDNMTLDQDFLPVSYFTLTQKKKEHAVTGDLLIKSNDSQRLRWLGGIFGFYRHSDAQAPVTFKDYGIEQLIESHWNEYNPEYPIRWDERTFPLHSRFSNPGFGMAIYGEAAADIGRLTLTAGLRLDYERSNLSYDNDCSTSYTIYHVADNGLEKFKSMPVSINMEGKLHREFNQLLPKFTAAYNLEKHGMIYATISKGYKAGGFNTQMFSDVLQQELMRQMDFGSKYKIGDIVGYKPEKSWNYEIGGKFSFIDGRLTTEAAAFYIDCRDQQLTVFPDGTTTGRIMANAGKTRSAGFELAVTAYPIKRLQLKASYGYTNAKFVEFDNGKYNYSGKFIPYAPQNTIFAAANYTFRIGDGFLRYISVGADIKGAGKIYWNESNSLSQGMYVLLNGNIRLIGEKYSLNLWTKNATSTQYSTFYFVSIEHEFLQRGKPAQFGATLRINV